MKKILLIATLLFSLIISGCATQDSLPNTTPGDIAPGNTTGDPSKTTQAELLIKDYFAYQENTKYVYEGQGNEYASYTVFVDYLKGNRVQLRSNNGGTETVRVLENNNGELSLLVLKGEAYYREDLTQGPNLPQGEVLLKEPLTQGTSWTLADNRKRSISNIDVEVNTPSGTYKAIEVTTEGKDSKVLDYYAPNVGLVRSVFQSNGMEVSSTLSKMEKNVPLVQTVKFYYPNINDGKLYYTAKKLSFNTNDLTKLAIEKEFKSQPQGNLGRVIGPNVKIKSLYLNKDNKVYVDFTKELISEMNAGSGYESMILQSIVNTLGGYYGVEQVYLTVEGEPYSSGHVAMNKGEFFKVNLNNSVELK